MCTTISAEKSLDVVVVLSQKHMDIIYDARKSITIFLINIISKKKKKTRIL